MHLETASLIPNFFLLIMLHPEVQKRAQDELDQVIGRKRLPDFSDIESLPYVDAMVREVLRWIPTLPLGMHHSAQRDDEYRGFKIPKGTLVFSNSGLFILSKRRIKLTSFFRGHGSRQECIWA